uniref:Putative ovule protein n=1 Tax=Solanum chacoense TaxID=4108 RepID=A0A0V0HBD2_SOLCH
MEQLDIEGNIVKDPAMIKEAVQNFYINLYKEAEHWRPDLNIQDVNMITGEEQLWLQRPFEEEEILESIRMCAKEKAPGPDGFPMIFFETFWEVLKKDIINTLSHFHSNQNFEKSFNATFIALIPKKAGASELKDYRPISLIGGVYKIIAKLLAERLKRVVSKLVNKNQMAFIKGRQIMDAALIAVSA